MKAFEILFLLIGVVWLVRGIGQALALAFPVRWRSWYDRKRWPGRFDDPRLRRLAYVAETVDAAGYLLVGAVVIVRALSPAIIESPSWSLAKVAVVVTCSVVIACWITRALISFAISHKESPRAQKEWTKAASANIAFLLVGALFVALGIWVWPRYGKDAFFIMAMVVLAGAMLYGMVRARMSAKFQVSMISFIALVALIGWQFGVAGILILIVTVFIGLTIHDGTLTRLVRRLLRR